MNISYDEVRRDSEKITEVMLSSNEMVPSFFKVLSRLKYHFFLYLAFVCISAFMLNDNDRVDIWLGVFTFGLLHWLFLFAYFSGYESVFSMLDKKSVKDLKLVVILSGKFKVYGIVWAVVIFALGLVSTFTELSVGALVFGNFIFSIIMSIIFNIDTSRYQISSLIGTVSAIKKSF